MADAAPARQVSALECCVVPRRPTMKSEANCTIRMGAVSDVGGFVQGKEIRGKSSEVVGNRGEVETEVVERLRQVEFQTVIVSDSLLLHTEHQLINCSNFLTR